MYLLVGQTEVSKTYSMPKSYIRYSEQRQISEEQKEIARQKMKVDYRQKVIDKCPKSDII